MKVLNRDYQCPTCNAKSTVETNHIGEIYSGCKYCGNGVLYCIEPEAIKERDALPYIETTLHYYRFSIHIESQKKEYLALRKVLTKQGLHVFDSLSMNTNSMKAYKDHGVVKLYTGQVFDNQWISDVGRVHDWAETIYPNKDIKEGYYLIITNQMKEAKV